MTERSDSMKKAQKKYMEKFAVARVRIERGKYEVFQALVEARGESVSGFFNRAVDEAIAHDTAPQQPQQKAPQQHSALVPMQQEQQDDILVLRALGPVSVGRGDMRVMYTAQDTGREYYVEPAIPDDEWETLQKAKDTDTESPDELPF